MKNTFLLLAILIINFNVRATQYPVYHGGYNGGVDGVTCDVGDTIVFYAADPGSYDLYVFPAGTQVGAYNAASYGDTLTRFVIQGNETSFGLSQVIPNGPNPPIINGWTINLTVNTPCTITIPDANFKTYLLGNTAINTNGDSEIQCSEANSFTGQINTNSISGIFDVTGIEAFTALTELFLNQTQISSLDVSANVNLDKLSCGWSDVSSLDISNNTSLTYLAIYSNLITSIDLSNNPLLSQLWCYDLAISTLDLSNNPNLTVVYIPDNQLSMIDLSNNDLINILTCSGNSITSLDLSNLTGLSHFTCNLTDLQSLDLRNGNNVNIINNAINITNNPDLTCINVDDAPFSAANWTNIDVIASFSEDCASAGLSEDNLNSLVLYPNPTSQLLNIEIKKPTTITVSDIDGSEFLVKELNGSTQLDLSSFAPGVYLICISEGQTVKFIKE